jgi:hypothetical protein
MERGCASYSFPFSLEFYRFVLFTSIQTARPAILMNFLLLGMLAAIAFSVTGAGRSDPPCGIRLSPARNIACLMSALLNPVGNHKMGEKSKREYD